MKDAFEPGAWSLGKHYRWIDPIAIVWVFFISIVFLMPPYSISAPWKDGFTWEAVNYAPILVGGALLLFGGWWLLSAKNWFKGPVRMGTEEELEAMEAGIEARTGVAPGPGARGPELSQAGICGQIPAQTPKASASRPKAFHDPGSAHPGAAVLVDCLAGHAARVIGQQPGDGARDLLGLSHPPERDVAHRLAKGVVARAADRRGELVHPCAVMSVSTHPGQIAFTWTFSPQARPRTSARGRAALPSTRSTRCIRARQSGQNRGDDDDVAPIRAGRQVADRGERSSTCPRDSYEVVEAVARPSAVRPSEPAVRDEEWMRPRSAAATAKPASTGGTVADVELRGSGAERGRDLVELLGVEAQQAERRSSAASRSAIAFPMPLPPP